MKTEAKIHTVAVTVAGETLILTTDQAAELLEELGRLLDVRGATTYVPTEPPLRRYFEPNNPQPYISPRPFTGVPLVTCSTTEPKI